MTQKEKQIYFLFLGVAIVVSAVCGGAAGFIGAKTATSSQPFLKNIENLVSNRDVNSKIASDGIVGVVDKASPAVVSIIVTKDLPKINPNVPDIFRQFFGNSAVPGTGSGETQKQEIGGGSGFILSDDGFEYTVLLNNGDKHPAKVLARDPLNDVAVIKIDATKLPTLNLGDSDSLKPGQSVIAIGNALGEFRNTVSTGVVSGLARSITASSGNFSSEKLVGLIQTDASINPGNSGGPLLDTAGRVVGINVAVAQGAQNIGFALPINQVKETIESVRKNGRLIRAWLGVRYIAVTPELAKENKLAKDYGVLVLKGEQPTDLAVMPGSPADKAGIEENDIILEADGKKLPEENPLSMIIARRKPGDILKLKVLHNGREKDTTVVLEEVTQ